MKSLLIGVFLLLFFISFVSANEDYFCFTKLGNNDAIPSTVSSIANNLICKNGACTCHLNSGQGYCLVCTNSTGWYASYNDCNGDYCTLDPNENVSLGLFVNVPFKNNDFLSKNRLLVSLTTTKLAKIDLVDNTQNKKTNLCMHCNSFSRTMSFREGLNSFTFISYSKGETKKESLVFFVDTKKPRILQINPASGKYTDGDFNITYNEDNLASIKLYYGVKNNMITKVLTNCASGKKTCSVHVDLSSFENQKINYYFEVFDTSNISVLSSKYSIFVDTKKPVIKSLNYVVFGNYVTFSLNVDEANLDRITYFENGRENVLCSSLVKGVCSRKIGTRKGPHIIKFQVKDRAGNFALKELKFEVK